MQKILNFIGGEHTEPQEGRFLDNVDPSTGQVYSHVPDSGAADIDRAVDAAGGAFHDWSHLPAAERSRFLLEIAGRIDEDLEAFALAECVDTGKPLQLAREVDIPRAVSNLRFFGTAILHVHSESHSTDHTALNYTLRRARGIAGLISPWNLPLYLLTWKLAPALATGNTVLAKPSELTPMTAFLLSQVCRDVGLPPGVVNIIHGAGVRAGEAITRHPRVGTLSFTGGTQTGAAIAGVAGPLFKKVALELGGKNPNIIFADADFEQALQTSVRASFSNQGQICLCGSRIFVERPAYDRFVEGFVEAASGLVVGDPLEPGTQQGALVSEAHRSKVLSYVELAREEGGAIRCGGAPPQELPRRCHDGFFLRPTVITGLPVACRVNREEIFGPVVTITPFDSETEVVEYANDTPYGLSASVWTQNLSRAHRLAENVQSGTVWVNCWMLRDLRVPFGGMKQSGVGREGGEEALRFFTEPKNICIRIPSAESDP